MVKPASKPMPICTELSARTTGTPSPPAPTSAAITTIDKLSMMHWVMPAMMVAAALGQLDLPQKLQRRCTKRLAGLDSGASAPKEIPRCVRRIGAGRAKITVDMRAGDHTKARTAPGSE